MLPCLALPPPAPVKISYTVAFPRWLHFGWSKIDGLCSDPTVPLSLHCSLGIFGPINRPKRRAPHLYLTPSYTLSLFTANFHLSIILLSLLLLLIVLLSQICQNILANCPIQVHLFTYKTTTLWLFTRVNIKKRVCLNLTMKYDVFVHSHFQ